MRVSRGVLSASRKSSTRQAANFRHHEEWPSDDGTVYGHPGTNGLLKRLYDAGWFGTMDSLLATVTDTPTKALLRKRLETFGLRVAREWSKPGRSHSCPRLSNATAEWCKVNAVATCELVGRRARVVLCKNLDDLRFGEATLAHRWISLAARLGGNPQSSLDPDSGSIPHSII